MLIHACLHLDKHFVTTHVQFTSFNDIVNLVREITSPQPSPRNTSPQPSPEERETANLQVSANLEGSEKENNQKKSILDIEKSIYQTKPRTDARTPSLQVPRHLERDLGRGREGWGEVFWERFEAKCIKYNFADTVFRYLVMVRHYYNAPLPSYLVQKYQHELTEDDKQRFINHLSGAGNEFIGRGAPKSATETHILHLKQLKNPVDFMRYVKGVVFPGKEFMISKYLQTTDNGQQKESQQTTDNRQRTADNINSSSHHHIITSRFWWLWYGYRWAMGLKGLFKMLND